MGECLECLWLVDLDEVVIRKRLAGAGGPEHGLAIGRIRLGEIVIEQLFLPDCFRVRAEPRRWAIR